MIDDFLWQYLDINDDLIEDLKYHCMKSLPNNGHVFQNIDIGITQFMGMEIKKIILIRVGPNAIGRIHTDYRSDKNFGDILAINVPLINCQDSITQMWKSNYTPKLMYTDNGEPYNHFWDKSRCLKITEFKLTKPVLFRTDIPHSVNNSSDKKRQAISLRFKIDPWHLIGK